MEKKNMVLLTVIAVATLLVAVVGATFAYFTASVGGTGNTANNTTSVTTVTLASVTYEGTSSIDDLTQNGVYPGWKGVQTFTIELPENTPADAVGKYQVNITPNVPSDFADDITYSVYKTTNPGTQSVTRVAGTVQQTTVDGEERYSVNDTLTVSDGFTAFKTGTLTGSAAITVDTVSYDGSLAKTTYYVVYEYANADRDQSAAMGDTFTATVNVELIK